MVQGTPIGLLITLLKAGAEAVYPILPLQTIELTGPQYQTVSLFARFSLNILLSKVESVRLLLGVEEQHQVNLSSNQRIRVILSPIGSVLSSIPNESIQQVKLPEVEGNV